MVHQELLLPPGVLRLHLSWSMCPFLAVVLVNSAPQLGQVALAAWPDFSRWWRRRLLKVENCRPLHPCSQHRGLGRLEATPVEEPSGEAAAGLVGIWYIIELSWLRGREVGGGACRMLLRGVLEPMPL